MTQIKKPNVLDVLQFATHDDLALFKPKGSHISLAKRIEFDKKKKSTPHKKGVIFVSPSKEDLTEGKGHIITSFETLHEQYDVLSHWTPNTFWGGTYYDFKNRVIKGHTKDNLKQVTVIGFDIDTKTVHPYEIFVACTQEDLPRPNLVIETPRGYQGFFVLSTPLYMSHKTEMKALRLAERLSSNILSALRKHLPIDPNCNPFGFFRIPNDENIVYFDDEPANNTQLISWSKAFEKNESRKHLRVIKGGINAEALDYTSSEWFEALINAKNIDKGHHSSGRNNTLLTLALAAYASGKSFDDTYDVLDQFNSNLICPLSKKDFDKVLKSAFSGKYKGPKRSYVEGLLELWTEGNVKFQGREGWHKFKKDRDERTRSHYTEREEDILNYLNNHITPDKPFFTGSLKELAEIFGMALSTLKEVLKRSSQLIKQVKGSGRGSVTMLSTKVMYLRSLLRQRRENMQNAQLQFKEYIIIEEMIREAFNLPVIDSDSWYRVNHKPIDTGSSPPARFII